MFISGCLTLVVGVTGIGAKIIYNKLRFNYILLNLNFYTL